jgi:hypothetical protein
MARQDDVEQLLRQVAQPLLPIAREAQTAAAEFRDTDWARRNLERTASVNHVSGTARRRIACDLIVARRDVFANLFEVITSDSEHNQGRYYLRSTSVAVLLTVRRKPHDEDKQPATLQMQFDNMRELVEFEDEIIVYFAIPPFGEEPRFEIATRGEEVIVHRLVDLIARDDYDDDGDLGLPVTLGPRPVPPTPGVRSTIVSDDETAEDDDQS